MDVEYSELLAAITAIAPVGVFELRLLGIRKGQVDSGYFNSPAEAASALVNHQGYFKGIYITPNPVKPDIMARSYNRISPWAQHSTNDNEITSRRWLLVDIDAKRDKGISSSEAEHQAALDRASTIKNTLTLLYGFPAPMWVDSGNGSHLMYRIDEPNTEQTRDELHTFLRTLKALFDDERTDVDVTVFNAARIWRVPGTWARKGDSTPDRPHRRSKVLELADPFSKLSIDKVLRFNAQHQHMVKQLTPDGKKSASEYPDDEKLYKRLNEYAMHNMASWVPHFFPDAREYKEGYRVSSESIGESHEEDLTIHPWPLGIKYFGIADQGDEREGRRTPVSVIAQYSLKVDKTTAATALSVHLNFPISEFTPLTAGFTSTEPATSPGDGMAALLGERPKFNFKGVRSVADLQRKEFKAVKWIVEGVIPTGNMLLAARPKMRKTWLALQLSMAIASGRQFLGWDCNKGDVLYLALEDNERRMQNRIKLLQKWDMSPPDLSGFRYWTGGMGYDGAGHLKVTNPEEAAATEAVFPRGEAGVEALHQFLDEFPQTSTIIIDTLAHFRGERQSRDIYASDYEAMMPLTKLATARNVLVIPVTHEKKGNADKGAGADFLEDVTGSAGMTGGTDGVISIKGRRGVQEENESRKIFISGRDVPFDYEVDVAFDAERGGWLKSAKEDVKVTIRALLTKNPFLNQQDFGALIPNVGRSRLYAALTTMKMEGEIEQGRYGYSLKRT